MIDNENAEGRAVIRYEEKYDNKGRKILKPIYLKETPPEEIQRMNEMFREHKKVKQNG